MSDIPSFPYRLLWQERQLVSVVNLTRKDGHEFLDIAPRAGIKMQVTRYPLAQAILLLLCQAAPADAAAASRALRSRASRRRSARLIRFSGVGGGRWYRCWPAFPLVARQPRDCGGRFVCGDGAGWVAVEADARGSDDHRTQVPGVAGVVAQGPADLLRGHGAIERGQDLTVNAQLYRTSALLIDGEGRGPGLGEQRYSRVGATSRAGVSGLAVGVSPLCNIGSPPAYRHLGRTRKFDSPSKCPAEAFSLKNTDRSNGYLTRKLDAKVRLL
jgi:hypothetical protein